MPCHYLRANATPRTNPQGVTRFELFRQAVVTTLCRFLTIDVSLRRGWSRRSWCTFRQCSRSSQPPSSRRLRPHRFPRKDCLLPAIHRLGLRWSRPGRSRGRRGRVPRGRPVSRRRRSGLQRPSPEWPGAVRFGSNRKPYKGTGTLGGCPVTRPGTDVAARRRAGRRPLPSETPDLESGRALYREGCAPCHGAVGGGDGWAAPGMIPRPGLVSRAVDGLALSPRSLQRRQVRNRRDRHAVLPRRRASRELWDIAFFVMTLRDGFGSESPSVVVPLSLKEVASQSDEELLRRLRVSRPGAQAREIDYYRSRFRRSEIHEVGVAAAPVDSATAVAEVLERTFARVAEVIFPSVVGVSAYERSSKGAPSRGASSSDQWTVGDPDDRLYPGFARTVSEPGFSSRRTATS